MKKRNLGMQVTANIVMSIITASMLLPIILLFLSSITEEKTLIVNGYSFFPNKLSMEAYRFIFTRGDSVLRSYAITIIVTLIGTSVNLLLTSLFAYPLSIKNLPGRNIISFYVFFTMLFNGGLVPSYLMWTGTFHIKNTLAALIIPNFLVSAINILLIRTYFSTSIPSELYEAAQIDGAGQMTVFIKIVLPLGKPILVTIGLFSGLMYWNDWTNGLYYLTDTKLFGIQNFLNKMITDAQFLLQNASTTSSAMQLLPSTSVKMAIAFVAMLPIIAIYPFLQKYFQSGITLGAVKG